MATWSKWPAVPSWTMRGARRSGVWYRMPDDSGAATLRLSRLLRQFSERSASCRRSRKSRRVASWISQSLTGYRRTTLASSGTATLPCPRHSSKCQPSARSHRRSRCVSSAVTLATCQQTHTAGGRARPSTHRATAMTPTTMAPIAATWTTRSDAASSLNGGAAAGGDACSSDAGSCANFMPAARRRQRETNYDRRAAAPGRSGHCKGW
jgi:hypothetical protein